MSETAIAFEDLGHFYRPGQWVFRHYTARIGKGSVFAILGPNGRGKSTLLHTLLGAVSPCEGKSHVAGRIAFVPQLFQVGFDYTVLDMVLMGRARRISFFAQPSVNDERAALAALDRFGLGDLAARTFQELSGGQRQLVILARAMLTEADIWIMDEPTSALDLKNQALVLRWIERLSREDGLTVVMTTHHPHHALAVADRVLLMLDEQDHIVGHATEVLTDGNLTRLYGTPVKRIWIEVGDSSMETVVPIL